MELGSAEIQVLTSVGARRRRARKAPLGPGCHRRGTRKAGLPAAVRLHL